MPTKPPTELRNSVYSNFDHELDSEVVEFLRTHPNAVFARHAAWDFNGSIWFDGELWHEEVWEYKRLVGTYSNTDLSELIESVNKEYGYK